MEQNVGNKGTGLIKFLLVLCAILAVACSIAALLVSSVIYKKDRAAKNPYYWCDATWQCCAVGATGGSYCDSNVGKGLDITAKDLNTYLPYDLIKEGSPYHQNCILPVKNAILNYNTTSANNFNLGWVYETGSTGPDIPSVYGPGCTGPGGTGKCADPTYNPQTVPTCNYFSFDAPTSSEARFNYIMPSSYSSSAALPISGTFSAGNSATLGGQAFWNYPSNAKGQNLTYDYMKGTSIATTDYTCPLQSAQQTQSTFNFARNNTFYPGLITT